MPPRAVRAAAVLLPPFLALAACSGSTTAPVQPSPVPAHDLVFEGVLDTAPELLLWDAGSGAVRRVLPAGLAVTDPQPSPDGAWIAFVVADYVLHVGDVYRVRRDGTGLIRLTHAPELDDQPTWSPDGARIAFRSFRAGREGDIWVMDADGGNPVNLTPDLLPGVTDESVPAWSPDGRRIAYASNNAGNVDLWTMAADGSDQRQLTFSTEFEADPAWSPDGAVIAFRRTVAGAGSDIVLVPAAGGAAVPLPVPGDQRMPVWTPDGALLVVVHQPSFGARRDLYALPLDGSPPSPLVTDAVPGGCLHPAFLRRR